MDSPKYNRTFHMPWGKGATHDDKIAMSMEKLIGNHIILTEKVDGSNTSLEAGGCFARTHSGAPTHASFDLLKALHATVKFHIPEQVQLFGEWCYAKHSIEYTKLPGYFLLFGARELNGGNPYWDNWSDVEDWAEIIGVPTVPVLFRGQVSSEKELKELVESFMNQRSACGGIREGVVARVSCQFTDDAFPECIMKCVRANHVQTSEHWKDQEIVRNKLKL